MLSSCLTLSIFCKNSTGFIVSIKYIGTYKVYSSQFVNKLPNPHTFMGCITQDNILNFASGDRDNALLFTSLED